MFSFIAFSRSITWSTLSIGFPIPSYWVLPSFFFQVGGSRTSLPNAVKRVTVRVLVNRVFTEFYWVFWSSEALQRLPAMQFEWEATRPTVKAASHHSPTIRSLSETLLIMKRYYGRSFFFRRKGAFTGADARAEAATATATTTTTTTIKVAEKNEASLRKSGRNKWRCWWKKYKNTHRKMTVLGVALKWRPNFKQKRRSNLPKCKKKKQRCPTKHFQHTFNTSKKQTNQISIRQKRQFSYQTKLGGERPARLDRIEGKSCEKSAKFAQQQQQQQQQQQKRPSHRISNPESLHANLDLNNFQSDRPRPSIKHRNPAIPCKSPRV